MANVQLIYEVDKLMKENKFRYVYEKGFRLETFLAPNPSCSVYGYKTYF